MFPTATTPLSDYFYQGQAYGNVANALMANNMDYNAMRPWLEEDGRIYVGNVRGFKKGKPDVKVSPIVANANATLKRDEWFRIDQAVIPAALPRMQAWSDLKAAPGAYNVPNGMGTMMLLHQTSSDLNGATVSMDGLRRGERDRPVYGIGAIPLPIIHKELSFSLRELLASRNGNTPLDVGPVAQAAEKVAEEAEKMTLGVSSSFSWGGAGPYGTFSGTIYGYTNFPSRITYTITPPTAGGWTPGTTIGDILAMRQLSQNHRYFGPWKVYFSAAWDEFLDDDYSALKGDKTLRERIAAIRGIQSVDTLDYLTGYQILMVQMTPSVARALTGMDIKVIQYASDDGMAIYLKVLAILVAQLRADQNGNTGIVHGS